MLLIAAINTTKNSVVFRCSYSLLVCSSMSAGFDSAKRPAARGANMYVRIRLSKSWIISRYQAFRIMCVSSFRRPRAVGNFFGVRGLHMRNIAMVKIHTIAIFLFWFFVKNAVLLLSVPRRETHLQPHASKQSTLAAQHHTQPLHV